MAMMLKPSPYFPITYLGPEDAEHRIWIQALTHGREFAPRLAIEWAKEELRPRNVRVALVAADPQGMVEEGYGFVDLDGDECVDFPWHRGDPWGEPYLRTAFDLNSEFGMSQPLSERSAEIRRLLDEFKPTFTLALHETWNPLFWGGAGILLIETYPTSQMDWALFPGAITGREGFISAITNPAKYLAEMVADWARGVFRRPTYRRLERGLSGNPHYQLISRIAERYKALGGPIVGQPWTDYLGAIYKMSMVGEGRLNTSLETGMTDWLTLTSYCVNKFGCPSVTTETFDPIRAGVWGIEERGEQSFLMIKATVEELDCA